MHLQNDAERNTFSQKEHLFRSQIKSILVIRPFKTNGYIFKKRNNARIGSLKLKAEYIFFQFEI